MSVLNFISGILATCFLLIQCQAPKQTTARFILLSDTQSYVEDVEDEKAPFFDRFTSQTNWILENKEDIDLVLHQGDITNRNIPEQWELAKQALSPLDGQVPYALTLGNHDMGTFGMADNRNTDLMNRYFPYDNMSGLPAFGGVYEDGKIDNTWYLLETGKYRWLILNLEFGPRDSVLQWADQVAKQHPDRTVILNTHCYMYFDDTRLGEGDWWTPHRYDFVLKGLSSTNDGEEIWEKLVKVNPNIRFVFSGHVLGDGCGTLISKNEAGYPVYQMLANFQDGVQGSANGGDGYFRDLMFDFENKKLTVKTFSAYPGVGDHPAGHHHFVIDDLELVGD